MLLYVNACFRKESRTARLAAAWLAAHAAEDKIVEVRLADEELEPLNVAGLSPIEDYNLAVSTAEYDHAMFDIPKQFAQADTIVVAAPMWNYTLPARLHDYLELACSQGVTFDITPMGEYVSLCRAKRLVFVTTAGGPAPESQDDHAFGYLRTLATRFWHIPRVEQVAAWGLDVYGADVDALLAQALQ